MKNSFSRDSRLDIAKALAISLVLTWHLKPIKLLKNKDLNIYGDVFNFLFNEFYHKISLIAVPIFILVSFYLFFQKLEPQPLNYSIKRFLRIGGVFLFWTFFQITAYLFANSIKSGKIILSIDYPLHKLLIMGGPPLPYMGDSVFYYLFVLLLLIPCSYIFFSLKKNPKIFSFVSIIIITLSAFYFEFATFKNYRIPYWRIDNFFIYIPISYFLVNSKSSKINKYIPFFYIGYLIFSLQDIYLGGFRGYYVPIYARLSIVFGSIAVFSSILQLKDLSEAPIYPLLSKYSLGIYAVHKYWGMIIFSFFSYYSFRIPYYITNFPIDFSQLIIASIATILTFVTVFLFKNSLIKRFIY